MSIVTWYRPWVNRGSRVYNASEAWPGWFNQNNKPYRLAMPATRPIASAAGLIQAIKGTREPLLVAYSLMDTPSMQRLWARGSEALDQENYTAAKIAERVFCDDDLTECFEWPGVDPEVEDEWRSTARARVTRFVTLLLDEVRTSVNARVESITTSLKNSVEAQISSSELAINSLAAEVNSLSEEIGSSSTRSRPSC